MDLEKNKIFAAVLVAGIAAYTFGFISEIVYHSPPPAENAYYIDVPEDLAAAGAADTGPTGPEPIAAFMQDADAARGETQSRSCAACHTFNEGGANGIGPNLWNIVNKGVGTISGFAYSTAMAEHGGRWTYEELNQFLHRPRDHTPGTKMNFIGIPRAENRANVIAYLRSLSDNPAPLPEPPAPTDDSEAESNYE